MTARRVQVRITRERTGLGDLVAEVACPGGGTRAEFIGYPLAIEIADGHVRCCRPLQDDLVRDPAASPRGLAAQLGRTVAAVRERRRLLGLPAAWPARRWEPYEDELLRACPSLPDAEAMLPDRSRQALVCRARHLHHRLIYRRQETAA